jgi:hypothetical protein
LIGPHKCNVLYTRTDPAYQAPRVKTKYAAKIHGQQYIIYTYNSFFVSDLANVDLGLYCCKHDDSKCEHMVYGISVLNNLQLTP